MNYLKDFQVPFRGLKIGTHDYAWEIDKKFFEIFENPDVNDCDLKVNLQLEKQERMLILDFEISGTIVSNCDRCLGDLEIPVQIREQYIVKLGRERKEESVSVMIIPETDYRINISNLIFDFITLAIPIKKVHQEDNAGIPGCDPKILKILDDLSHHSVFDPRWDALKNLKIDNNN